MRTLLHDYEPSCGPSFEAPITILMGHSHFMSITPTLLYTFGRMEVVITQKMNVVMFQTLRIFSDDIFLIKKANPVVSSTVKVL